MLCCLLFCLLTGPVQAQVTIQGKAGDYVNKTVCLYAVRDGFAQLCAQVTVGNDKRFTLSAELPAEGFYTLGNTKSVQHVLYLKGNEKLSVSFTNQALEITRGNDTRENKLLQEWEKAASQTRMNAWFFNFVGGVQSPGPDAFAEEITRLRNLSKQLEGKLGALRQKPFGKLMKLKMEADVAFFRLAYRRSHIGGVPENFITREDLAQYDRIFRQAELLQLPLAPAMVGAYVDEKAEKVLPAIENPSMLSSAELKSRADLLENKSLRELYIYQKASQLRYYERYTELRETFRQERFSDLLEQQLRPVEEELAWSKPGSAAPDFKGELPNGKWLSLSDLRGKVVVMDVWATWCTPCLRLIPDFKRLEKEISHPELAFMSVCIGASPEKDLWEKLVKKHELRGNVVFVEGWTRGFAKDYQVTGVPRFMIIDREGKVWSFNAPSPKYPQLKQMILQALEKKK